MIKQEKKLIVGVRLGKSPLKNTTFLPLHFENYCTRKTTVWVTTELDVRKCNGVKTVKTWRDRKEGPDNNLKQGQGHSKTSVGHSCGGIQDHKVWWSFSLDKKRCVCHVDGNQYTEWSSRRDTRRRHHKDKHSWKWLRMNYFCISNWHLIIISHWSSSLVLTQPNNSATQTS